jgi:magnesium chelatase accessory protein
MGAGPVLLLAHGTGAATHSWRDLAPLLAEHFTVVGMDLPGHGFTEEPPRGRYSLSGMASALADLLAALDLRPDLAVGHSAGAAVLARMCLDGAITPRELISLNGAFIPFGGAQGRIFAPMAKFLAEFSVVPRFFAWNASDPAVVTRLLRSTGSTLDSGGTDLYRLLARNPGHLGAALQMMANWDLAALLRDLDRLTVPLTLVVGLRDGTVAPGEAHKVRAVLPSATILPLPGLGHLAHEERPAELADLLVQRWRLRTAS